MKAFVTLASAATVAAVLAGGAWITSCGPRGFPDEAVVNSVRILATRADHPYAKPGETVTLTVLATDQRASKPEPMVIYWLPDLLTGQFFCENPPNDAYYGCFTPSDAGARSGASSSDAGQHDAGSGGGRVPPCATFQPGIDLSPCLPVGPTLAVSLPKDIITSHPPVMGTTVPYGVAIVFNMACAGHPEVLPVDQANLSVNQLPIGCFDQNHNLLSADSYVIGYATLYSYETLTNQNPVIANVLFQGKDLDGGFLGDSSPEQDAGAPGEGGVVIAHCTASKVAECPSVTFDVSVPPSSQERDLLDKPLGEQLWVDYYITAGTLSDDARLLYDPTLGKVTTGTSTNYQAPMSPTPGTFWAVVHDNRGGVAWDAVPFLVK